MSVNTAIEQLLEVEASRGEGAYGPGTLCVGVARLGADSQSIVAGTMDELRDHDFGPPLHSLVIAGDTHVIEEEILSAYRIHREPQRPAWVMRHDKSVNHSKELSCKCSHSARQAGEAMDCWQGPWLHKDVLL